MNDLINRKSLPVKQWRGEIRRLDDDFVAGLGTSWAENVCEAQHKRLLEIVNAIYNAPTVDAVPVVRCKDCIHRRTTGRPPFVVFVCSHNKGLGDNVKDDDFCSYGEKREDNHD